MNKLWEDVGSDVNWIDYGGRWAMRLTATTFLVLQFSNCEEWGDGATGYHVELSQVAIDSDRLPEAFECCGIAADGKDEYGEPIGDYAKAEALYSYGAQAPVFSESGTNAHKLIREAKRRARKLRDDSAELDAQLDKPVNKIGSTAREYRDGDLTSALGRGLMAGDPKAELLVKMGMR